MPTTEPVSKSLFVIKFSCTIESGWLARVDNKAT